MTFKPTIFFRADGNSQIGLGHITRCMALADMLQEYFRCIFLVQNPSAILKSQIEQFFDLIILPDTSDFVAEAYSLTSHILKRWHIVVLDHYQIQTEYQKILKTAGLKVVCIDDMHAWHFLADVVINHAGGVVERDYFCEPYTQLYLGLEYALLRPPFLDVAQRMTEKGGRSIEKIERVFICFGGADSQKISKLAAEACLENIEFTEIHVVLGSAFKACHDITPLKKELRIHFHQNLNAQEMCDLMLHCHLAVVPASSISLEAFFCQMYLLLYPTAENQGDIAKGLLNYFNKVFIEKSRKFETLRNGQFFYQPSKIEFVNPKKNIQDIFQSL